MKYDAKNYVRTKPIREMTQDERREYFAVMQHRKRKTSETYWQRSREYQYKRYHRIKETDPERYAQILARQREYSRQRSQALTHTCCMCGKETPPPFRTPSYAICGGTQYRSLRLGYRYHFCSLPCFYEFRDRRIKKSNRYGP